MRCAAIIDGIVDNTPEAVDGEFAAAMGWVPSATAQIGDHYDKATGQFTRPTNPEPPSVVPASVTQRQARLALLQAGKLADVQAAIAALPGTHGEAARIEWEYASTIERASPLVAAMGASLQWDASALDSLFRTAAAL